MYESKEGKRETPIIVHRAMLGTLDRFMGILIEQYAGKFPLWLNPEQVRIVPVAPTFNAYAEEVKKELFAAGLRVEVDDSHETMNKKIRTAQLDYVNYILVVGDKEKSEKSVNIRTRDNQVHGMKKVSDFCKELVDEVKNRK